MVRQSRLPRLILTRPRAQAERFATSLAMDIEVVFAPLIEIVWSEPQPLDGISGVILTSENGALSLKGGPPMGMRAYCVGPRTTKVAVGLGLDARNMGGTAECLVAALSKDPPAEAIVHLRGTHARGNVAKHLVNAGLNCAERVVYDQKAVVFPAELARELAGGAPDFVALFSPRTAQLFSNPVPSAPNAELLCLSDAVAESLDASAYKHIEIAEDATGAAMAEALYRRAAANRLEGPVASR